MARVETGHIHLGSSILHHREGWETKSLKKTAGTHRNTRTVISTPACMHAHKHTNKNSVARPVSYKKKTPLRTVNCIVAVYSMKTSKTGNTHRHMIHFPAETDEIWIGALPLGMAVCPGLYWSSVTLSSTARKRERGEKRGKETVNREKQVRHIEISFFFYYLLWRFSVGKLQEFSTAFDSSTCGLGIHASLSYVWDLATRQTATHVNNILDWVMTWWIMNVSHETSS